MGIRDWFGGDNSAKFADEVESRMRNTIRVPGEIMQSFRNPKMDEVIERSRKAGDCVDVVALRAAVGIYVSHIMGDESERSMANKMYMPLKMFVGNVALGGEISSEEVAYCEALIGKAFRESTLRHGL